MAAIIDGDVSIDEVTGDIRWTGAAETNRHTVLEFIQLLQDKQDDGQAVGDILLDITVDTPFNRSTDQIVTLNSPFNVEGSAGGGCSLNRKSYSAWSACAPRALHPSANPTSRLPRAKPRSAQRNRENGTTQVYRW